MKTDTIIIGGGLAGASLALALAKAGISSAMIDSGDPAAFTSQGYDGRVSALAYSSRRFLEGLGICEKLKPEGKDAIQASDFRFQISDHAEPILEIRISDQDSVFFVHFERELSGDAPMGHIVENRYIRQTLYGALEKEEDLHFLPRTCWRHIEYGANFVTVTLDDGQSIQATLLIAADGKESDVRKHAGIEPIRWQYDQGGIVCTIKHEKPHHGIAQERFLPAGPFAILPMKGGHHSSLVWTERAKLVPLFMKMNDAEFLDAVRYRFTDYLGHLELAGPRFAYPLSFVYAKEMVRPRLALVGDAAHTIHPLAGQGFNLGLRDIETLADLLKETKALGLDIGGLTALKRYQAARRFDTLSMGAFTDGLNRLFSNQIVPITLARRLGMAAVNQIPPVKRWFVKRAMGITR